MPEPGTLEEYEAQQEVLERKKAQKRTPTKPTPKKPGDTSGLNTITGAALMQLDLPEPPAVVTGFFVEGLTLLASRPKLGKSWLMLTTAVAVATGGRALGKIQVEKGEALYLGLEDNQRRLQSRLEVIADAVPERLHLATSGAMSRLYEGGLEQLDTWLTAHPACRLVVIDTLARVRPPTKPGADLYSQDAVLGAQLQELATKHSVALVLVHHVRKALAEDFLDTVSGSTGLTGVADAVLVLTRQRGEADAVLHVTGRDIEEASHALQFDPSKGLWSLLGNADVYALTKERQTILAYLAQHSVPASPKEVSEGTGLPRGSTRNLLAKLRDEGLVRCPERGLYVRTSNTDDSDDNRQESASSTQDSLSSPPGDRPMTDDSSNKSCHRPTEAMTAPMTGINPVQDSVKPSPVTAVTDVAQANETPPEVNELHRRFKSGKFADQPELEGELKELFSASRASASQKARLLELAQKVHF